MSTLGGRENLLKRVGVVSTDWKIRAKDLLTSGSIEPGTQTLNAGDIRIEYHPRSGKDACILSHEEFKQSLKDHLEPMELPDDEPWSPFHSREDFEFADLVHDAALNRPQIERFIKLIRRCQDAPGSFTFQKYGDLKDSLDNASKLLTPVVTLLPHILN